MVQKALAKFIFGSHWVQEAERAVLNIGAFLAQYPHLALRLPSTQIASYLGITPEFLSKVRSELK